MGVTERPGRRGGSPAGDAKAYLDKSLSWEERLELARQTRAEALRKGGERAPLPALKPWETDVPENEAADPADLAEGGTAEAEAHCRSDDRLATARRIPPRIKGDGRAAGPGDKPEAVGTPGSRSGHFAELSDPEGSGTSEREVRDMVADRQYRLAATRFRSAPDTHGHPNWRIKIAAAMLLCLVAGGSIGFWVASLVLHPSAASEAPAAPGVEKPASNLPAALQRFRFKRTAELDEPESDEGRAF